jgi:L-threonylcarbamoyladenylate synthase
MREIKLTTSNKAIVLKEALDVLKQGGVIIYPTETSYGLGADFYNKSALAKIYKIKKRDTKNPLPVLVPDLLMATTLVKFSKGARLLASKYWPGPLTLVLPFKYCRWQGHCDDFLALRVSNHPLASNLVTALGNPLVATSANLSNQPNCYKPEEIIASFAKAEFTPDLFINVGSLPVRKPSTLVKFVGEEMEILRQGNLKIEI